MAHRPKENASEISSGSCWSKADGGNYVKNSLTETVDNGNTVSV